MPLPYDVIVCKVSKVRGGAFLIRFGLQSAQDVSPYLRVIYRQEFAGASHINFVSNTLGKHARQPRRLRLDANKAQPLVEAREYEHVKSLVQLRNIIALAQKLYFACQSVFSSPTLSQGPLLSVPGKQQDTARSLMNKLLKCS